MGYRVNTVDMTPGTAVNPAAAGTTTTMGQVIKTFPLDVTDDEYVTVHAEFFITTTATSQLQDVPLILQIGANQLLVNIRPYGATAAITKFPYNLWFTAVSRSGDVVNVGIAGGLTADAQTSINVIGFKVVAESGTRAGT